MRPRVRPGAFVFVVVADNEAAAGVEVLASVAEPEGLTVVTSQEEADAAGFDYDFVAGWIMLEVHSALAAVGLTAAVASALAEAGISCNVLAGYFHDHLLVPSERVAEAVDILHRMGPDPGARQGADVDAPE